MSKRFLCILLCLLMLSGCGSKEVELSGAGYQSLSAVGDTCYLVDDAGVIYTLDWDSGKAAVYYRAPEDVRWVSSPDLSAIYYIQDDAVRVHYIETDAEATLAAPDDLSYLLCVTDHYLVFAADDSGLSVRYMDLETLEIQEISWLSEETWMGDLLSDGDTLIFSTEVSSALNAATSQNCTISALDLTTGERTILAENTDFSTPTLLDGRLYYRVQENDSDFTFYSVPLDGSEAPNQLEMQGLDLTDVMMLYQSGPLLAVSAQEQFTLYAYHPDTDSVTQLYQYEGFGSAVSGVSNGSRYAVLTQEGDSDYLRFGDLAN
jgi:outer membrane protein assembly factor BamB